MLELSFEIFMEMAEKYGKAGNQEEHQLHYLQTSSKFTLYIRSDDHWEYFTIVPISKIVEFGLQYEATKEQAIEDFKINYLSHSLRLKENEVQVKDLPDNLSKQVEMIEEEEAKDYVDFLKKKFEKWEKAINNSLERDIKDEIQKDYMEKTFGEFLSAVFNAVHTADFMKGLKRVIRLSLKQGINQAEEELNMDIGVGVDFDKQVKLFADRELDGFTIDGKRWNGLKGVAADLQNDVSNIVASGINEKKSLKDIQKEINVIFIKNKGGKVDGEVTKGRVMKIARTETNRFVNAGKLEAMKKSGIVAEKKWNSFHDNRTSEICNRLDGQVVPINAMFVDPKTGNSFDHPPSHPNCRSVVEAVIE